ncbi:hypothetical protein ACLB2K_000280 [Fragaria x ananassa]
MVKMMNYLVAVIAQLAAMLHTTEAEDYTVGDYLGWTTPPDGAGYYAEWASEHIPLVVKDDAISFIFQVGEQDVALVTKQDFHSCTTTNLLWQSPAPVKLTFTQEGTFYFIGTFAGRCAEGQKIALHWTKSPAMALAQCPTPSPSASAEANSNAKLPLKFLSKRVNKHSNKKIVSLTMEGAI